MEAQKEGEASGNGEVKAEVQRRKCLSQRKIGSYI